MPVAVNCVDAPIASVGLAELTVMETSDAGDVVPPVAAFATRKGAVVSTPPGYRNHGGPSRGRVVWSECGIGDDGPDRVADFLAKKAERQGRARRTGPR